jgi:hypothetical protein
MSTRNLSWGVKVLRADNLTTFMCRLSKNLGASTTWSPKGLPRPVMGLLYLLVSNELKRVRKEAYLVKFKALSWNVPEGTEEITKNDRVICLRTGI